MSLPLSLGCPWPIQSSTSGTRGLPSLSQPGLVRARPGGPQEPRCENPRHTEASGRWATAGEHPAPEPAAWLSPQGSPTRCTAGLKSQERFRQSHLAEPRRAAERRQLTANSCFEPLLVLGWLPVRRTAGESISRTGAFNSLSLTDAPGAAPGGLGVGAQTRGLAEATLTPQVQERRRPRACCEHRPFQILLLIGGLFSGRHE